MHYRLIWETRYTNMGEGTHTLRHTHTHTHTEREREREREREGERERVFEVYSVRMC